MPAAETDPAKKWGKLSIADALKSARSVPRIIKSGAAGLRSPETLRQRAVQHISSEEPALASLSRVSSKREKYLKVIFILFSRVSSKRGKYLKVIFIISEYLVLKEKN